MTLFHSMWAKIILLLAILALTFARWLVVRYDWRPGRVVLAVLTPLAILAGAGSFVDRAPPWSPNFLNNHDVYHYYFGAKYSDELGYNRLYHCTVVALDQMDPKLHRHVKRLRSLNTYRHSSKSWYLAHPKICTDRFSTARWKEFKQDLQEFSRGRGFSWRGLLVDKGYNATPVWNSVGRLVASHISPQPWLEFNALGWLDLALLLAGFTLAGFAFGPWGVAIGMLYLGSCWSLTPSHIRGGFLRLDWLAMLIAGLAALQLKWHRTAGLLLAYAAMVRVFPAMFLFGPAVKAAVELWRSRTLSARYRQLFGSFVVGCVLLGGISVVDDGGLHRWKAFAAKIDLHNHDIATMRIGLEVLLGYRGETQDADFHDAAGHHGFRPYWVAYKQAIHRQMQPVRVGLALVLMALLGWLVVKRDDVEAAALSFPVVFALMNPTFYYYCLLVAVVIVLASRSAHKPALRWILVALALLELSYQLEGRYVRFEVLQYMLQSMGMAALVLLTLGLLGWDRRRPDAVTPVLGGDGGGGLLLPLLPGVEPGEGETAPTPPREPEPGETGEREVPEPGERRPGLPGPGQGEPEPEPRPEPPPAPSPTAPGSP